MTHASIQLLKMQAMMGHKGSEYLLKYGRIWTPASLPADVKKMPARQCFYNAGNLALEHRGELFYVEGYGVSEVGFPVVHGWCVDRAGRVVDPTWKHPENCSYFGIAFTFEFFGRILRESKYWGLLENPVFWGYFMEQEDQAVVPTSLFNPEPAAVSQAL